MRFLNRYVAWRELQRAQENAGLKRAGEAEVGMYALEPGGSPGTLAELIDYVSLKIQSSTDYYSATPPTDFRLVKDVLTFTSRLGTPDSRNAQVVGKLYRARRRERAVLLLPHWNARRADYHTFSSQLARLGITCLQLSLPYHDERQTPEHGYASELVCENLGLTISANRQAVLDARACLDWLEREGYVRLGIIGMSIGSSIASLVAAHDSRIRCAALLLMADDFAEVVWTGSATTHIRHSLERRFSLPDIKKAWALISPNSFAPRLADTLAGC